MLRLMWKREVAPRAIQLQVGPANEVLARLAQYRAHEQPGERYYVAFPVAADGYYMPPLREAA